MRLLSCLLVAACLAGTLSQQQQGGKRRRVKKKILVEPVTAGAEQSSPAPGQAARTEQMEENAERPKTGRGFLDEYYRQQFESRTESALAGQRVGQQSPAGDQLAVGSVPQFSVADTGVADRRTGESDLAARQRQLEALLAREAELSSSQREELLRQLQQWPVSPDTFQSFPDPAEPVYNDVSSIMVETPRAKKQSPFSTNYISESIPNFLSNSVSQANQVYDPGMYAEPEVEEVLVDERSTGYTAPASGASKYFGLTGTTSQDIQLGLTFTVPFLSIPLTSINSLLGGNLGQIGDFLNFNNIDLGSIATMAVIAIAAVFVLPQAIYWLTGINLDAFNWGRSDDVDAGGAAGIVALANTVDTALQEFNIDSKGCMARSMCDILYGERSQDTGMFVKTIASTASRNPNMMAYLGSSRAKSLQEFGAISEKYGGQPGSCSTVFRSTCPWDSAGVSAIVMKLMASQGTSLAELALKAATAAASNR